MKERTLPDGLLADLAREHGTPLWVYDAAVIAARYADLAAYDVVRYAQKANGNLAVLELLRRLGAVVDAVSAGEVVRARAAGFPPSAIVYTADLLDAAGREAVAAEGLCVNAGSRCMLDAAARAGAREVLLRVNPGFGHGHDRKVETGGEASKHGIWHADVPQAIDEARALGLCVVGLHVHVGSGAGLAGLTRATGLMEELAAHARETLTTVSCGGGLPIPYRPGEERFDLAAHAAAWRGARDRIADALGRPITLEIEPGRWLVAESGVLLVEVCGTKRSGGVEYVLVDGGFNDLLRPAMYGAYHHVSVVGRAPGPGDRPRAVAGPLCESSDLLTQGPGATPRPVPLPEVAPGDLLCVHDAGAYGASMSSNYNARTLAAEVLVEDGRTRLVRRRQTFDEMLSLERPAGDHMPSMRNGNRKRG